MNTRRRGFLKSLAVTPLAPAALLDPQVAPAPAASPTPSPSPAAPSPAAQALTQVVQHRYGTQLDPGDLDQIAKGIEDNLQAADRLRKRMKLGNADEPVATFRARPPKAGGGSQS